MRRGVIVFVLAVILSAWAIFGFVTHFAVPRKSVGMAPSDRSNDQSFSQSAGQTERMLAPAPERLSGGTPGKTPSPKVSPSLFDTPPDRRIELAISTDDPCLSVKSGWGADLDPVVAARVLLQSAGQNSLSSDDIAAFSAVFRADCALPAQANMPSVMLSRGICLLNHPEVQPDALMASQSIFYKLLDRESDNGAFYYLLAAVNLKRDPKAIDETYGLALRAMRQKHFDFKRRALLQRLLDAGYQNSGALATLENTLRALPQPDLVTTRKFLESELVRRPHADQLLALSWTRTLARRNLRRFATGVEGLDWSVDEYETARKLGVQLWKLLRGDQALPEEFQREPSELLQQSPAESAHERAWHELLSPHCERTGWDHYLEELKAGNGVSNI